MKAFSVIVLAILSMLLVSCSSTTSSAPVKHGYEPSLNPADFTTKITNPYFPLPQGWVWTYKGIKDGHFETDITRVTSRTKIIEGIRALGVSDISYRGNNPTETTIDWYSQDKQGNVWYLGEDSVEAGETHGSWAAGVHDGEPGIIMPAQPFVPQSYRQEYSPAQGASDMAWTVAIYGTLTVPYGTAHHVITSLEWSELEPGVVDRKSYAPGIGIFAEHAMSGPQEDWLLVSLHK